MLQLGTYDEQEEAEGSFSLERAFAALQRRWHVVALVTALSAVAGVSIAMMLPNVYEAAAVVQIDPRKKTISNLDNVLSDLKADAATVDSEVEVIRSRAITLKVIDSLGLRSSPEFSETTMWSKLLRAMSWRDQDATARQPSEASTLQADKDRLEGLLGKAHPGNSEPERDEVAVAFGERLKVARVRNTLLIEIRFSARNPEIAAKVANAVAEFYLADQLAEKRAAAGFATGILEEKLETLKAKVAAAERKVELFKAENSMFDSEGELLTEKQLARSMEQLVLARNATAETKAKYQQAQLLAKYNGQDSAMSNVLESHTIRLFKDQLATAKRREAELRSKYGARHPDILKISAEVAEAKNQVNEEIAKLITSLKNEYEVAERREKQLEVTLAGMKDQQVVSKEASIKLKELEREATTEKQLFEVLLARYKQTAETQELQLPDARIVEQSDVPIYPASPKRKQIVLIATLGGLFLSLAFILVLEFATFGVSRPEDVERTLELPHIGSLPMLDAMPGFGSQIMRNMRLVIAEPRGTFAEAIRGIRREIDLGRAPGTPRVVLVASSLPGEGCDAVASNLAHHYALTGERVLLMDGDMRRAPLTRQLAPQREIGLLEALSEGIPIEDVMLRDSSTGLCFLPAMGTGTKDASSPELLASISMARALGDLKQQFDTIVIGSPPLLAVVDGRMLADYADQILFVMAWRKTPKQLARRALRLLGYNQEKISGVVINQVDPEQLGNSQGLGSLNLSQPRAMRRAA